MTPPKYISTKQGMAEYHGVQVTPGRPDIHLYQVPLLDNPAMKTCLSLSTVMRLHQEQIDSMVKEYSVHTKELQP